MEALNKILDRIIDFFSIFDISFLISGIATFSILCYGAWLYDLFVWLGDGIDCIIYYIVLAYICGLLSFAFGKCVRTRRLKSNSIYGQSEFMICFKNAIYWTLSTVKIRQQLGFSGNSLFLCRKQRKIRI